MLVQRVCVVLLLACIGSWASGNGTLVPGGPSGRPAVWVQEGPADCIGGSAGTDLVGFRCIRTGQDARPAQPLPGLEVRSVRIWRAHDAHFPSIALSPDGRTLAAASPIDPRVLLWSIETGEQMQALIEPSGLGTVKTAFSPDGKVLACAGTFSGIRLWEVASGKLLGTLLEEDRLTTYGVSAFAFSPTKPQVAFALGGGGDTPVWFVDLASGRAVRATGGTHTARINDMTFSPGGRLVVTASDDRTLKIWDAVSGGLVRTIPGHRKEVTGAAVSPDGRLLSSVSNDQSVRVWEMETGTETARLSDSASPGAGIAFTAEDAVVFRSGNHLTLLDPKSRRELSRILLDGSSPWSLAVSADGKTLAVIDKEGMAQVWSIAPPG